MGVKVTTDDKGTVVYRKDKVSKAGKPYTTYSIRVSSKKQDGEWDSAFMDVGFTKGASVKNKTTIEIKDSFVVPNNYGERTGTKIVITDFSILKDGEDAPAEADDPFGFTPMPEDSAEVDIPF